VLVTVGFGPVGRTAAVGMAASSLCAISVSAAPGPASATDEIEHHRACERPDRDVAGPWVERVPEPGTAQESGPLSNLLFSHVCISGRPAFPLVTDYPDAAPQAKVFGPKTR
jgi:hypothetical protein